ncbi:MAG: transcriptional repressor, partial [Bacteroidota bacterium]
MSRQKAVEILKQRAQRITNQRVVLLEFLMDCPNAFVFSEIEEQLSVPIDRFTIYRTLQTFEDAGLVIKMINREGVSRYM